MRIPKESLLVGLPQRCRWTARMPQASYPGPRGGKDSAGAWLRTEGGKGGLALPAGGGLWDRSPGLEGHSKSLQARPGGDSPRIGQPTVCTPDPPPGSPPSEGRPPRLPCLRPGPLPFPSRAPGRPQGPAHAIMMTLKSSQFQGSRRNVKSSMQKPRASILMRDSKV